MEKNDLALNYNCFLKIKIKHFFLKIYLKRDQFIKFTVNTKLIVKIFQFVLLFDSLQLTLIKVCDPSLETNCCQDSVNLFNK